VPGQAARCATSPGRVAACVGSTDRPSGTCSSLTVHDRGDVVTVDDLLAAVEAMGGRLDEDAPRKQVADAIRWEIAKGRVRRAGWGRYAPGHVPRSTVRYMRRRLTDWTAFEAADG
jgi:hypothetical protein